MLLNKKKRIEYWERKKNVIKLIKTLRKGMFDLRILCAKALGNIGDKTAIPELIFHLDDPVENVRLACTEALQKIDPSEEINKIISEKLEEWENLKHAKSGIRSDKNFDVEFYQWNGRIKRSMSWTNVIREQLKKPMR